MRTRNRNAVALLIGAAALGVALVFAARATPVHRPVTSALQAVPENASVVAWARLDRLRASALAALVSRASDSQAKSAPDCSKSIFEHVREAAVWIAPNAAQDFGIAALGEVQREQFLSCASEAIGARGGQATAQNVGGYTVVRDRGMAQGAAALAMREGGPVLLGRARELSQMMAAVDGRAASALQQGEHASMRAALKMDADVVVTARVTDAFRAQLDALAQQGGVDWSAVRAAAVGLEAGSAVHLRMLVWCEPAGACEALAQSVQALLSSVRGSMGMRVAGVAGLLREAAVGARDGQMVLDARAPAGEVVSVVQRIWRWNDTFSEPPNAPAPSLSLPDEVLRAPGAPRLDGGR